MRETEESLEQGEVAMQTGQTVRTYALFVGADIAAQTATIATQRPGAKASRSLTIDQTPEGYGSSPSFRQSPAQTRENRCD